jgi:hypothetical protein
MLPWGEKHNAGIQRDGNLTWASVLEIATAASAHTESDTCAGASLRERRVSVGFWRKGITVQGSMARA